MAATPQTAAVKAVAKKAAGKDKHAFKPEATGSVHKTRVGPQVKGGKLLMTEFILCFLILGFGTIVSPKGSSDGVPRLISRGSGLSLLFFILALVATAGGGAKRAANGLGGLVTVAYLVTSSDAKNILEWIKGFYSTGGVTPTSGGYVGMEAGASTLGHGGGEDVVDVGPLGAAGERQVGSGIEAGAGG